MDNKALFSLTYGLFMLSAKDGDSTNGCIINTCNQVANDPARIAISVLNTNLTCDMIKHSGIFALSVLDDSCIYDTLRYYGMQSGRDVDKMSGVNLPLDINGVPYLPWSTCALISARVIDSVDLGTHTMFIAEIVDMRTLSDLPPLTYADYHSKLKPKQQPVDDGRKIVAWRCKICGYVYEESVLPGDFLCPWCTHGADEFEPIYAD